MEEALMNHPPDTAATTAGNGGHFNPRQAAALLNQTTQQARRQLQPYPPWLLVIRATIALAACGAVWLAVRAQHPYTGPTVAVVIPVVFAFVVINFGATVAVARRSTAGMTGRSRLRPAEIAVMTVAWVGVFVVMGVLAGAGVSRKIVYGLYPATAPLIVAGLAWAALMAARANWRACGTALAVAAVGAAGTFAGPASAWAVDGVGLFLVLLGSATAIAWQQRRSAVRP
jgi:hypothetical protein